MPSAHPIERHRLIHRASQMKTTLVSDVLDMATTRRQPQPGHTVLSSDHGAQYATWLFGKRTRAVGLLGSMGPVGDCFNNSLVE